MSPDSFVNPRKAFVKKQTIFPSFLFVFLTKKQIKKTKKNEKFINNYLKIVLRKGSSIITKIIESHGKKKCGKKKLCLLNLN